MIGQVQRAGRGARIEVIAADATAIDGLPKREAKLLIRYARQGCLSFVVRTAQGLLPFVLQPMRIRQGIIAPPTMQMIYCRKNTKKNTNTSANKTFLLARGKISVILDAN